MRYLELKLKKKKVSWHRDLEADIKNMGMTWREKPKTRNARRTLVSCQDPMRGSSSG
jgi:hypothetical protein